MTDTSIVRLDDRVAKGLTTMRRLALVIATIALAGCSAGAGSVTSSPSGTGSQPAAIGPYVVQGGSGGHWRKFTVAGGASLARLAVGSDNSIWYVDGNNKVGRTTMAGQSTEFSLPANTQPRGIVGGPDGNLWVTDIGNLDILRVTTTGTVTAFPLVYQMFNYNSGGSVTVGQDGALWFASGTQGAGGGQIGRITTSGSFKPFPVHSGCTLGQIAWGPDNNLWFTQGCSQIGRMDTSGNVMQFLLPTGDGAYAIIPGTDGTLYFDDGQNNIGRITTGGAITLNATNYVNPVGSLAQIGNIVYFSGHTSGGLPAVGRFDITTQTFLTPIAETSSFTSQPVGMVEGPDENLWMSAFNLVATYVLLDMKVTPTKATLTVGQQQTITVTESNYTGSFAATSSAPAVASVAPNGSGSFIVTANAVGSVKITISDTDLNFVKVSITVH
jgi:virginiamycin B lyase